MSVNLMSLKFDRYCQGKQTWFLLKTFFHKAFKKYLQIVILEMISGCERRLEIYALIRSNK